MTPAFLKFSKEAAIGAEVRVSLKVEEVQKDLRAAKLDGWLFYDFRGRDPIAHRILHLPAGMRTRRWFYFIPAKARQKSSCTKSRRTPWLPCLEILFISPRIANSPAT